MFLSKHFDAIENKNHKQKSFMVHPFIKMNMIHIFSYRKGSHITPWGHIGNSLIASWGYIEFALEMVVFLQIKTQIAPWGNK